MPGLVRKLIIFAAVDGLILQPSTQRNQKAIPGLQIKYSTHELAATNPASQIKDDSLTSFDAHGIVGSRPLSSYELPTLTANRA